MPGRGTLGPSRSAPWDWHAAKRAHDTSVREETLERRQRDTVGRGSRARPIRVQYLPNRNVHRRDPNDRLAQIGVVPNAVTNAIAKPNRAAKTSRLRPGAC